MGTYSNASVPSISMEIDAAYQDLSTLIARLLRDPGDLAAMQKMAMKQTQIERLEATQSAVQRLSYITRPRDKTHVA